MHSLLAVTKRSCNLAGNFLHHSVYYLAATAAVSVTTTRLQVIFPIVFGGGCVGPVPDGCGGRLEVVRHEVVDLVAVDDELDAVADEEDEDDGHQHRGHSDVALLPLR